jgi:hypothetical protein
VKFVPPKRRLKKPRAWRSLGKILRPSTDHRRLGFIHLSRIIYWHREIPVADVRAQVIVALFQLQLVSNETFQRDLLAYIRGFRRGGTLDAATTVATDLISRWSFPESHRAFRKYVASSLIRAKERIHPQYKEKPVSAEDIYPMIREAESAVEFDSEAEEDEITLKAATEFHPVTEDHTNVEYAASILGVCRSHLYKLIKQGRIQTKTCNRILQIPEYEIVRLSKSIAARRQRREVIDGATRRGAKLGAARKAIYRKFGPSPRI